MGTLYTYPFDLWRSEGIIAKVHLNYGNCESNCTGFHHVFSSAFLRAFPAIRTILSFFSDMMKRILLNIIQPTNYKIIAWLNPANI